MKTHNIDNLFGTLEKREKDRDRLGIREWLLSVSETEGVSIGSRQRETAGVYSPSKATVQLSGRLYVRWQDGLASRIRLSRPLVQNPEELVSFMREAAFADPYAPDIPPVQPAADVEVFDPAVSDLIGKNASELYKYLDESTKTFRSLETKNCLAGVSCRRTQRRIASSSGLRFEYDATRMGFSASADSLYGAGKHSRDLVPILEVRDRLEHLERMVRIMRDKAPAPRPVCTVILSPSVAQALLWHYLLKNLDAEAIFDGRSAFSLETVEEKASRFHPGFSLWHNPCRPMHPGSYPMDGQGLGARPVCLVENGKIKNARVTLKGSKQTGWPPTPSVDSDSLEIKCEKEEDLFDYVGKTERGYIATSVLGLHTQDSGTGDYSLAVPRGVVVENGEMKGSFKGVFSGNFFDDLNMGLVALDSPWHSFKGLAFEGRIDS